MRQAEFLSLLGAEATPATAGVPGFTLREDYLSPAEEQALIAQVDSGPWETDWKRRIQQFGLGYTGQARQAQWVRDFPPWLQTLAERIQIDAGFDRRPENSVINEYIPPQGIAPHVDYPAFGPRVACVSLGSDVILDLISPNETRRVPVYVPARSLWVLSGRARTEWKHGIAPRLTDVIQGERRFRSRRISITFRTRA